MLYVFALVMLHLFALSKEGYIALPKIESESSQDHVHSDEHADPTQSHEHDEESNNVADFSYHEHTHRHSPDEPEHTHTHHHSVASGQSVPFLFGSNFQYVVQFNQGLQFGRFNATSIQSPYLDSVFRPPIA